MSRWRFDRIRFSPPSVVWVTLLWVMLWGEFSAANILTGVVIGVAVPSLLPLPRGGYHGKIRPWGVVRLVARFFFDLFHASFQVASIALSPRHAPHGGVVGIQLHSESDLYLTFTAEITTLVPGSVVVEALRRNSMMYVHVLDLEMVGGPEGVRRQVLAVEERVLRALASDEELARAGLEKRR